MIALKWDTTYDDFLAEARPLIENHWAEVGSHRDVLVLDPDHQLYRNLERAGRLHILTARVDGMLAGYLFVLIAPHPRDRSAVIGRDDIFYVVPEYRRLRLGPAMIEEALRYLDGRAHIVMFTAKLRRHHTDYLARFGFHPQEQTWAKVLRSPHEEAPA